MAAQEGEREPLLHAQAGAPAKDRTGVGFPWLTVVGFAFLTFNSAMAIYRSRGDRGAVAFVAFSYVDLVSLFLCLRWHERAPPASVTRRMLKVAVWVLVMVLAVGFSYKVAAVMPVPVMKVLVWWMAAATVLGGSYAFFLHRKRKGTMLATLRSHSQALRDAAWSGVRFIVDSGATRHAVGNMWLLESYKPFIPPFVAKLADGSSLRILGIGHIKRGNFSIPNVSHVEGLLDGLISTAQLDRHHHLISCLGNGVCRIMEADGTEVGGAILEDDDTYVLRFLEVPGSAQV
ncbi:unnamed protein product [Urochloa decumbens]|uniref:Retrovirus-related Pol polyprotein from transposon TNT 1-94-like beta-barrel domain-containing protein n=1 Tax=Urochloa decumbens TaxID=240449 RepID=A0ABC9ANE1_9POAL